MIKFSLFRPYVKQMHLSLLMVLQFVLLLCMFLLERNVEIARVIFLTGTHGDQLKTLLAVLEVLSTTDVQVNVANYLKDSAEEVSVCTETLISLKLYKEASLISGRTFVVLEVMQPIPLSSIMNTLLKILY